MCKIRFCLFILLLQCMNLSAQDKPTFYLRGLLEMWRKNTSTTQKRIDAYNNLIPPAIQSNVVYSLNPTSCWYYTKKLSDYSSFSNDNYLELCKRVDSTGISFVVDVAEIGNYSNPLPEPPDTFPITVPASTSYYLTPAQVDKIFARTKNCVGIESGENFWTYNATTTNDVLNFLRVCKKYNKKYIIGEGGWGYCNFVRFFNENYTTLKAEGLGKYLYPVFKNTKPYAALVSQSSIMGAWITGLTAGFGTWNDEWAWCYGSFRQANEFPSYLKADNNQQFIPFTHYLKSWLLTIAMGGNTSFMESSTFSRSAMPDANQNPYLLPFIKGIAQHNILPSKKAVIAKVKAITNPFGLYTMTNKKTALYNSSNLVSFQDTTVPYKNTSISTYIDPYGLLYKNTYGIWKDTAFTNTGTVTDVYFSYVNKATGKASLLNAVQREVLPNNPRFLIIPLLPHLNDSANIPTGIQKVDLNTLTTNTAVSTKFKALYPSTLNDTSAWGIEIDNSFFVINSNENADIDQYFTFSLGNNGIDSLKGVMPFQNILFGKREGLNDYWFQSNGYAVSDGITSGQKYSCPIKNTVLKFKCKSQPTIEIEDNKEGYITQYWNEKTKVLQFEISHVNGAVNFRIKSTDSTLPVVIQTFTAKSNDRQSILNWKAIERDNFSHYELEYSIDGLNFSILSIVNGGNLMGKYSFTHNWGNMKSVNEIYYRIKAIEKGGNYNYSAIQKVTNDEKMDTIKIIPTMVGNCIQIIIDGSKEKMEGELLIIDSQGRVVINNSTYILGTAISMSNLSRGVYSIKLKTKQHSYTNRWMKR